MLCRFLPSSLVKDKWTLADHQSASFGTRSELFACSKRANEVKTGVSGFMEEVEGFPIWIHTEAGYILLLIWSYHFLRQQFNCMDPLSCLMICRYGSKMQEALSTSVRHCQVIRFWFSIFSPTSIYYSSEKWNCADVKGLADLTLMKDRKSGLQSQPHNEIRLYGSQCEGCLLWWLWNISW